MAESAEDGLALVKDFDPAVAVVDVVLPGMDGLQMLSHIKQRFKGTEVVVISSHASVEKARQALRDGACDYLEKPFENIEDVWATVERALERKSLAGKGRTPQVGPEGRG